MWRRFWHWLRFKKCPTCNGTGICARPAPSYPHSCCGDCPRRRVPIASVPDGWSGCSRELNGPTAIVGTGELRRWWCR